MFSRIAVSALFAGFLAGVVAALLQLAFVQPVLLHAELYESGTLNHFGDGGAGNGGAGATAAVPGIDLERDGLSVLFTALTYTGFAFLLVAAMALAEDRGWRVTVRQGLVWGVAGFLAFQLAPALGAPPELPGSAAAEIDLRQIWWFGTVGATAAGLALIAFGRGWALRAVAAALLLAPHLIGAPHPDEFIGPAPPELASLFAARALGVGLVAWAVLGLLAAYFWLREARRAGEVGPDSPRAA